MVYSKHLQEQMQVSDITAAEVKSVINSPNRVDLIA